MSTLSRALILVEPSRRVFGRHTCLVGNGIAQVEVNKQFRILVTNFGKTPVTLIKGRGIALAELHPSNIMESDISHAELFDLTHEQDTQRYRKRRFNAKNPTLINEYMNDKRSAHMDADAKPVVAEDIELDDVNKKHHPDIRKMLREHEDMWSGKLGEITVIAHYIDVKKRARRYKLHSYRSGPRARDLEAFAINKQVEADVIKLTTSE